MSEKIQIPAIHDRDLRKILEKFGVAIKIDKEEIYCFNCNEKITWENLFAFKVLEDNLVFFCEKPNCIENSSK
jgi:hypothetical protein